MTQYFLLCSGRAKFCHKTPLKAVSVEWHSVGYWFWLGGRGVEGGGALSSRAEVQLRPPHSKDRTLLIRGAQQLAMLLRSTSNVEHQLPRVLVHSHKLEFLTKITESLIIKEKDFNYYQIILIYFATLVKISMFLDTDIFCLLLKVFTQVSHRILLKTLTNLKHFTTSIFVSKDA